jgi:hypothetical protein
VEIEMSKKLFMLTQGEYSDYSVVGVFSTKENAESFKVAYPNDEYNDIEEITVDPDITYIRKGMKKWYVNMTREGGTGNSGQTTHEDVCCEFLEKWSYLRVTVLHVVCYAKSEEHAVKIANERRAQLIASGEWN